MDILFLAGLMLFAGLAVFLKDLLKAVICLMISSIFLGIIFFKLGAPYAGIFEISVVAGLIMVLFILTISLTGSQDAVVEPASFWIFVILFITISFAMLSGIAHSGIVQRCLPVSVEVHKFGEVLWLDRTFDMVGQISVIFAGVFVLLAIVGAGRRNGK
ncbi:MAG: Na(+)/H(+) antiporter subunit B [Candidatus Ratteibacteria bacterium]